MTANNDALQTLREVETYLAEREDIIDGDYGRPAPNAEMTLLRELRAAIRALSADRPATAWLARNKVTGALELAEPNEKASNPKLWTDGFPVYTAPPLSASPVAAQAVTDEMKELLHSTHEIALRSGADTDWEALAKGIAKLGIGPVTARHYFADGTPRETINKHLDALSSRVNAALAHPNAAPCDAQECNRNCDCVGECKAGVK